MLKTSVGILGFAMMCEDGLAHCRVHSVMPEGVLVRDAPQAAGDESPVAKKELRGAGRLIQVA